jgi:acyl-CoA synthetase (AMP-forming)/AMP-acid ligase II
LTTVPAALMHHGLEGLVARSLATCKQLHAVVVVDAVPRSPEGKVRRRRLRETWLPPVTTDGSGY